MSLNSYLGTGDARQKQCELAQMFCVIHRGMTLTEMNPVPCVVFPNRGWQMLSSKHSTNYDVNSNQSPRYPSNGLIQSDMDFGS